MCNFHRSDFEKKKEKNNTLTIHKCEGSTTLAQEVRPK